MLEKEFSKKLEKSLQNNGWTVQKEVVPDECVGWARPFRVDMIISKEPYGTIGLELKAASKWSGGVIGKSLLQLIHYRRLTYSGNKIIKWCLATHSEKIYGGNTFDERFVRELFCHWGLGVLERGIQVYTDRWGNLKNPRFQFGFSQPHAKIYFSNNNHSNKSTDIQKIHDSIIKKINIIEKRIYNKY